jgi:demethylsterigmatocystin 6-O-methyltransferase
MRNIMHDWPDEKCKLILENTKSAMTRDSVILIDEMVIPKTGASWRATQLDITMITCLAAQERTVKQFEDLFASAGLRLLKVLKYTDELGDSILVVVPE